MFERKFLSFPLCFPHAGAATVHPGRRRVWRRGQDHSGRAGDGPLGFPVHFRARGPKTYRLRVIGFVAKVAGSSQPAKSGRALVVDEIQMVAQWSAAGKGAFGTRIPTTGTELRCCLRFPRRFSKGLRGNSPSADSRRSRNLQWEYSECREAALDSRLISTF